MKFTYEEIMNSVKALPGIIRLGGPQTTISQPLAKEAGGTLYMVFMISHYDDPYPDEFAIVNTETGEADLLENEELMEKLDIKTFAEEPPESAFDTGLLDEEEEPGDRLEEAFAEAFDGDEVDWEAYQNYLGMLLLIESEERRSIYWAFRH